MTTETTTLPNDIQHDVADQIKKAKKSRKASPKKTAPKVHSNGKLDRSVSDGTASERRISLVKTLRKMGATGVTTARSLKDVAAKIGTSPFDVYGRINGTSGKAGSNPCCLSATGHVKVVSHEGQGLCVYLTKKGQTSNLSDL